MDAWGFGGKGGSKGDGEEKGRKGGNVGKRAKSKGHLSGVMET